MHVRMSLSSIWGLLLLCAGAYVVLVLALFLFQSELLYLPNLPSRALMATPDEVGLRYAPVTITTDDDISLHGWFVPAEARLATLLFFHGNAGNISHRLDSLRIFHELGLATLIIDYRGYGESTGAPSEEGTYRDAEAAWRYLTVERQIVPGDIVLFGRSLGGAVAARLATRHTPGALILESTFTSVPDLAAELYPFLPVRWLTRFHYGTETNLRSVSCPVLIVHSRDDEIIAFAHAQRLFGAAREPKRLLEIRGDHNGGFLASRPIYVEGMAAFLRGALRR
jgi:uncharacterized protein